MTPLVGVCTVWTSHGNLNADYEDQYVELPPLAGPDGSRIWGSNYGLGAMGPNYSILTITTANKNPEATIRWANYFYQSEYSLQTCYGSLGIGLSQNEDGTYSVLKAPEGFTGDWSWKNTMGDGGMGYASPEALTLLAPSDEPNYKLLHDQVYAPYMTEQYNYPALNLSVDDQEEINFLINDMSYLVTRTFSNWVVEGGIDEGWDEFIAEMERVGLPRYLAIYQRAYDASLGE
jgi:putative aldouronate transport system substrate-binding protein